MFDERLKLLRKRNEYTQVTLAEKLKVSKGTVAMWETGKRNPDFETLVELSDLFDVSIDYMLGRSDDGSSIQPTEDNLKQMAAWTIEDDINDLFKMYLSLDSYGQAAVEHLIKAENIRCREQKTSADTSNVTVQVVVNKNSIQV